jgi:hypothetical protein
VLLPLVVVHQVLCMGGCAGRYGARIFSYAAQQCAHPLQACRLLLFGGCSLEEGHGSKHGSEHPAAMTTSRFTRGHGLHVCCLGVYLA